MDVYAQICSICDLGKEKGVLKYTGDGKFEHIKHVNYEKRTTHKRQQPKRYKRKEDRELVLITAPQCLCNSGNPHKDCPYLTNKERIIWGLPLVYAKTN